MPLVNHAFVRMTSALLVTFVVFTALLLIAQAPGLLVRTQFVMLAIFVTAPSFWQGTKARFAKGTTFCWGDPEFGISKGCCASSRRNYNNHKGGTVTGGYGFGYVSDMYPSPF